MTPRERTTVGEVRRAVKLARLCRRFGDPQTGKRWMARAMELGMRSLYAKRAAPVVNVGGVR